MTCTRPGSLGRYLRLDPGFPGQVPQRRRAGGITRPNLANSMMTSGMGIRYCASGSHCLSSLEVGHSRGTLPHQVRATRGFPPQSRTLAGNWTPWQPPVLRKSLPTRSPAQPGTDQAFKVCWTMQGQGWVLSYIFTGRDALSTATDPASRIVQKCTAPNLTERYSSALDAIADVEHLEATPTATTEAGAEA